jgi:indoleamine 2,3-dioxygenase
MQRIPAPLAIPYLKISKHLELPPVATYAAVCLWNFKPIFSDEPIGSLENLSTLATFTGSLDESWFYLISVAIETRGAPLIPLMLTAIAASRLNDSRTVMACLHTFAEGLDELGTLLQRMYENCDPHVFYHRVRPFLAGSKNMADAGLPNGVIYEDGTGQETYRQYGGGSNAQSSLIQFFDIVLGVEHRPTGDKRSEGEREGTAAPSRNSFIHDMRSYMPGPHRRFLEHVSRVAELRDYVERRKTDRALCIAFDACLAMLRALRDKHIQMVSRYIIVKSRSHSHARSRSPRAAPPPRRNLANAHPEPVPSDGRRGSKSLRGTGGTALIPFLKQARDETGEPAIDAWARRILSNGHGESATNRASRGKTREDGPGEMEIVGLAGTWTMDDSEGGLCHW